MTASRDIDFGKAATQAFGPSSNRAGVPKGTIGGGVGGGPSGKSTSPNADGMKGGTPSNASARPGHNRVAPSC